MLSTLLVQLAPFVDPAVVAVGWLVLLVLVIVRRPRNPASPWGSALSC